MIDFLNSFKSLIKLEQIHTDNNVFKLHYKFTVILLIVFSILLTSKQYFGDPINCDVEDNNKDVISTYCWIYGTFIIKTTLDDDVLPGLGNEVRKSSRKSGALMPSVDVKNIKSEDQIIWQKYYQWVCIVFCFQALLFYLPRYLWKTWEGGRLRLLVKDLSGPLVTPNWNNATKDRLVAYLMSGKYSHNMYAIRYSICEVLNLVNVVSEIFLMDWFLTGQFSFYGFTILTSNNYSAMNQAFPKVTKCLYFKYGPSSSIESRDALCVLPLNILNEKLFLALWIWLFILSILSFLALMYRALVLFVPIIRMYLLRAQTRSLGYKQAKVIVKEISYGDFFLLYNVGKNVNPIIYKELLMGIHDYMTDKTLGGKKHDVTFNI